MHSSCILNSFPFLKNTYVFIVVYHFNVFDWLVPSIIQSSKFGWLIEESNAYYSLYLIVWVVINKFTFCNLGMLKAEMMISWGILEKQAQ